MANKALLSPKSIFLEGTPPVASVSPTETARTAMVVSTKKGPLTPALANSYDAWVKLFGTATASSWKAAISAKLFFEAGGRELVTQRVVHYADIEDAGTITAERASVTLQNAGTADSSGIATATIAFPIPVVNGDVLTASVGAAADQNATISCTAASKTAALSPTYNVANGLTTIHPINGVSYTITWVAVDFVDNTAITLAEALNYFNIKLPGIAADSNGGAPRITTDQQGLQASLGPVTGTAAAVFNFPGGTVNGTGNIDDNLTGMTLNEFEAIAEAAFTNSSGVTIQDLDLDNDAVEVFASIVTVAVGPAASIQVKASTLATKMGFDLVLHSGAEDVPEDTLLVEAKWVGAYGNNLTVEIDDPTNGEVGSFKLLVYEDDVLRESFDNLVIGVDNALDPDYVETRINGADGSTQGSILIRVTDLELDADPAIPVTSAPEPLIGGDDGLVGLADTDYTGSTLTATGLRGLDLTTGIRLLISPEGTNAVIHNALCVYAGVTREIEMMAILDPPTSLTAAGIKAYVVSTAQLVNLTEYAAIYWPWVKIANPNAVIFGVSPTITVPPSGLICGVIARTDAATNGGIYQPPAGVERGILTNVLGFATEEVNSETNRDLIYPVRINPLNTEAGQPNFINGVLTLKENGSFPSVSERRAINYIADLINRATVYVRHSNNDSALLRRFTQDIEAILIAEMNRGAFASKVPSEAFILDTGPGVNTAATRMAGQVWAKISVATQKPAQFVIFEISQNTAALQELLAQGS